MKKIIYIILILVLAYNCQNEGKVMKIFLLAKLFLLTSFL